MTDMRKTVGEAVAEQITGLARDFIDEIERLTKENETLREERDRARKALALFRAAMPRREGEICPACGERAIDGVCCCPPNAPEGQQEPRP